MKERLSNIKLLKNHKAKIASVIKGICFIILVIIYQCPFRLIFGIDCPGCGLTAAVLAAIRFDFAAAFAYHPLFPIPVITIIYLLFRKRISLPVKVEIFIGILFVAAFLIRYIIKLTTLY